MDEKERKRQAQFKKMTEKPVEKLVATLAVPTILSMLVTNLYNMVDTAFVGELGTAQSGAVGIVFGYMAILQAIGFMCGQGAGSTMSRKLGNKDVEGANCYSSTGFFMSLTLGLIIGLLSSVTLSSLVFVLGSTPTIAVFAKQYIRYIIIAAPFQTASLTMNNLLRYEGKAKLGMIGLLTGAILNICGDALFMKVFHMGVSGAGLSTMLTQMISFAILLYMFLSGKTQTIISVQYVSKHIFDYLNIAATGFPSLLRQGLNSISTMLLNGNARVYGDAAVAAMAITSRVGFFCMSVALGIGQGFQPVSSFNFGARKFDRVKRAYWFTLILSEVVLLFSAIPVFIMAEPVVKIFRDDSQVIIYATRALRLHCIALLFVPLSMVTEMGFQSTGQRLKSTLTSSLRSGVIMIPSLLILTKLRGMSGIQEAQPVAYVITWFICIYFSMAFLKSLKPYSASKSTE
ncbi:MAG: MATE family efflux transporter [Lachnospiraceae bacterium]|jgi:putative MATE family efflux protein|nr:MATE family efflux transporter [Lachnospiraceae bacterium]